MSWKPEVRTGSDPKWYDNALVFATRGEAEKNVRDLMMRWMAVVDTRVVESTDKVNYQWTDEGLIRIEKGQED